MSDYKECFCVGASKCGDDSCNIVKDYIKKWGRAFWKEGLGKKDDKIFSLSKETK